MTDVHAWHIRGELENAIIGVPRLSAARNRALVGLILGIYRWYLYPSVIRSPRGHSSCSSQRRRKMGARTSTSRYRDRQEGRWLAAPLRPESILYLDDFVSSSRSLTNCYDESILRLVVLRIRDQTNLDINCILSLIIS
jgi:hypothetical protein